MEKNLPFDMKSYRNFQLKIRLNREKRLRTPYLPYRSICDDTNLLTDESNHVYLDNSVSKTGELKRCSVGDSSCLLLGFECRRAVSREM